MTLKALGETARFINGAAFKPADWEDGGLPIIRIQNLTGTGEKFNFTSRQVKPELVVEPGDLLVSWSATLDVYRWTGPRGVLNQHIFKVLPNPGIDPDYLFYALKSALAELSAKTHGSTMKHVVRGDFESTQVRMPPLTEQRRIVDILSRAEGIVRLRREAEKKAAELIPALFLDMFGDPATNPKGWPSAPLGELCDVKGGGTPSKQNPAFWIGEIPWVSPKDMSGVDIIHDAEDHISPNAVKNSATNLVPVGSVLIVTRSGVLKHTIPCAITSREVAINQDIKAFVPRKGIAPHFLLSQLQIRAKEILGLVRVGATVQNIETEALKRMLFIYPSLDVQIKFCEKCEQIRSIQSQQSAATAKAQATFDALLAQVFQG